MPAKYTAQQLSQMLDAIPIEEDGCRLWPRGRTAAGYGRVGSRYAHRVAYELVHGPIREGLQLDHLCRNRACVELAHLEPVTQQENIRRGEGGKHWAMKTHCPCGHPYDGPNTYTDGSGRRHCRACRMVYQRRHRAKARAA